MIFKRMPWDYFGMDVIFTILGTLTGIFLQGYIRRKTGKTMYSLAAFNFVILGSLCMITGYQASILVIKVGEGKSILKAPSFC